MKTAALKLDLLEAPTPTEFTGKLFPCRDKLSPMGMMPGLLCAQGHLSQGARKSIGLEQIPWGPARPRGPGLREEAGECIPGWLLQERKRPERPYGSSESQCLEHPSTLWLRLLARTGLVVPSRYTKFPDQTAFHSLAF